MAAAGHSFASLGHAIHCVLITFGELRSAEVFIGTHRVAGTGNALAIEPRDEFFRGRSRAEKQK